MRVLFITLTYHIGGMENHMAQIIQHWPDRNDELHVLGLWGEGELREILSQHVHVHWFSEKLPPRKSDRFLVSSAFVKQLDRWLSAVKPDVILTFLWYPTWITSRIAHKHGIPLVWSVQNDLLREYCSPSGWFKAFLTYQALRRVSHAIAISPGIKRQLTQYYRFPENRISVIPNSIDIQKIHHLSQEPIQFDIPEDNIPTLVFVGRIEPQKGWPLLLEAVQRTRDLHYRVLILGRGSQENKLKQQIQKRGLYDRVHFMGFFSNPFPVVRLSHALISTSIWEPFGLVIAEAMALGKPVLATPTHGAQYIIEHEKNGYISRGFLPKDVEEGIRWLFSDTVLNQWDQIQNNARTRAQQFDAPLIARQYRECLENVLLNVRN